MGEGGGRGVGGGRRWGRRWMRRRESGKRRRKNLEWDEKEEDEEKYVL